MINQTTPFNVAAAQAAPYFLDRVNSVKQKSSYNKEDFCFTEENLSYFEKIRFSLSSQSSRENSRS